LKRNQLKKVLKPIIIECVREALYEEGVLSSIISEVVQGLGANVITESAPPARKVKRPARKAPPVRDERINLARTNLEETRKQLQEAVSAGSYNGVDLFEGTTPAPGAVENSMGNPLAGTDPEDPGIDISGIMAVGGKKWKALSGQN